MNRSYLKALSAVIGLALLSVAHTTHAADAPMKIKQVDLAANAIAISGAPANLKVGQGLIVNLEGGKQCSVKAKSPVGGVALADISSCHLKEELRVGQTVEASLAGVAPVQESEPATQEPSQGLVDTLKPRWVVYAGYDGADKLTFSNSKITLNGTDYTGETSYSLDQAMVVGAEGFWSKQNSWGFRVGGDFVTRRTIKSVKSILTSNATAIDAGATYTNSRLGMFSLYGDALYRWGDIYLPFGLNLTGYSFENPPPGLIGARGSIGLQFGVGCILHDHFVLELLLKSVLMSAVANDVPVGTQTGNANLGTGSISGANLLAKYMF